MATFISDNQKFHIFSKSPVRANMELFQATNKSGHTVISDEVRTDDIPWFINVPDVNNPPSYVKDPRKNDIIFQGKFNSLSTAAVCKKWDGEKWVDGPNLKENPILKNENDDDVIQVHFEKDIEYVSDTNNAGTTSDKQAAFVLKANGEMLTHFVSPTDKIYNGIPSNGYGLYLFLDSQLQSETDSNDNGYIANSYAGIIQFNKARSEGANKFKVITFEYIGGYLNKSLNKIEEDLKEYIDEEIKEHNEEFIAHKNNQNSEKHLSQSEVNSLNALTSASKISGIETATQYDYQAETDLAKALGVETTSNASDSTFKDVTITLHLRDKVLQQSTMPVTSKAIYNHVHKQSVDIEKASNNVTVEEVTTNENERRKYTIAVDGYTTSETDNIVDDIYEKIQATADDINKNVVEHTSNNGIHITDTERTSWNNNEVVLQKHLNEPNIHITDEERSRWDKGGNLAIAGDNYINVEHDENNWDISLNNISSDINLDNSSQDNNLSTVGAIRSHLTTFETAIEDINNKIYNEIELDNFSDANDNWSSGYGFTIEPSLSGTIKNIKVKCSIAENVNEVLTYLKIVDSNDNIIACSENNQTHGSGKELSFDFTNFDVEKDNIYKAVFSSTKNLTSLDKIGACMRVNYEGSVDYKTPSLPSSMLDENLNAKIYNNNRIYAIIAYTIVAPAAELVTVLDTNLKTHINDFLNHKVNDINHIFAAEYNHDNLSHSGASDISASRGYGFVWKPEKSSHINNIQIKLRADSTIFYYDPGELGSDTIINAQNPVNVCLKITDSANNKLLGISEVVAISNDTSANKTVSINFENPVPCVKNKTYLITFHSSVEAEKPDIILPIRIAISDNAQLEVSDYTIKKLIIDQNKNDYYRTEAINDVTKNNENKTYMNPTYLKNICVKVTTTRYTHPELELIADTIGDIWEYLSSMQTYFAHLNN